MTTATTKHVNHGHVRQIIAKHAPIQSLTATPDGVSITNKDGDNLDFLKGMNLLDSENGGQDAVNADGGDLSELAAMLAKVIGVTPKEILNVLEGSDAPTAADEDAPKAHRTHKTKADDSDNEVANIFGGAPDSDFADFLSMLSSADSDEPIAPTKKAAHRRNSAK